MFFLGAERWILLLVCLFIGNLRLFVDVVAVVVVCGGGVCVSSLLICLPGIIYYQCFLGYS